MKLNDSTDVKENEVTIETKRKGNTNWRNQKPPNKERGSKERKNKSLRASFFQYKVGLEKLPTRDQEPLGMMIPKAELPSRDLSLSSRSLAHLNSNNSRLERMTGSADQSRKK